MGQFEFFQGDSYIFHAATLSVSKIDCFSAKDCLPESIRSLSESVILASLPLVICFSG